MTAREGQVILTVRGRDARRRLWPSAAPESVALSWRGPGLQMKSVKLPLVRVRLVKCAPDLTSRSSSQRVYCLAQDARICLSTPQPVQRMKSARTTKTFPLAMNAIPF